MGNNFIQKILNKICKSKIINNKDISQEQIENIEVSKYDEEKIYFDNDGHTWLTLNRIYITDNIYIRIPTVGEVLENESNYYSTVFAFTSSPYSFMAQLDEMGIDFTEINDYQLFTIYFSILCKSDLSLIFGDLNTEDYLICKDNSNDTIVAYSQKNGDEYKIDELIYTRIASVLRKINNLKRDNRKPGNDTTKEYLLRKAKRKLKRNANKPYEPYLEKLVVALVNRPEFKYNYEEVMNMSIYNFNQSFKQIQSSITFDNTMIGVYAGTINTTKLADKSCLSWIPIK